MGRFTAFRFTLDATPGQVVVLRRHAGASRFAYNQCLRLVKDALDARKTDASVWVPWSGFDLINAFNAWKRSAAAGRVMVVDPIGEVDVVATGLSWRVARRAPDPGGSVVPVHSHLLPLPPHRAPAALVPTGVLLPYPRARSPTPPEGTALAHATARAKPAPMTEEPHHYTEPGVVVRTPEKGDVSRSHQELRDTL